MVSKHMKWTFIVGSAIILAACGGGGGGSAGGGGGSCTIASTGPTVTTGSNALGNAVNGTTFTYSATGRTCAGAGCHMNSASYKGSLTGNAAAGDRIRAAIPSKMPGYCGSNLTTQDITNIGNMCTPAAANNGTLDCGIN